MKGLEFRGINLEGLGFRGFGSLEGSAQGLKA